MCHIAAMNMDDYERLLGLWSSDPGIGLGKADEKRNLEQFLDRNRGLSFIAMHDSRIVGTILCGHDGRRGFLYHLFVLPEFRRKKIGTKLVDACLEKLAGENITKCHIMFFNHNESGRLFWEQIGFTLRDDVGVMSIDL